MNSLIDILGWAGAALLLTAYILVSTRRIEPTSISYQTLNIVGSVLLLSNNVHYGAFPSGFVNLIWTGVAALAIFHAIQASRSND